MKICSINPRYILKLEDTTITEAKKKFMILYWLDWLVKGLFLLGCYYLAVWLLRSDDTILNVGCEKCEKGILGFL